MKSLHAQKPLTPRKQIGADWAQCLQLHDVVPPRASAASVPARKIPKETKKLRIADATNVRVPRSRVPLVERVSPVVIVSSSFVEAPSILSPLRLRGVRNLPNPCPERDESGGLDPFRPNPARSRAGRPHRADPPCAHGTLRAMPEQKGRVPTFRLDGERVRRARFDRLLTQAELARKLGVCRNTVVRIERGEPISLDTLRIVCRWLACAPHEIVERR